MKGNHPTVLFLFLLAFAGQLSAQSSPLQTYIQEALENNIALQQKNLSYQRSLEALKEAKAMFIPKLSLEARYSMAQGGRTIEFPVGDLVNPAYENLNLIDRKSVV